MNNFDVSNDHVPDSAAKPAAPVAKRTPAQREASRRNGSRSRGPTTEAGKASSCRNSTVHGFLATKLKRLIVDEDESRAYEHLVAELEEQYEPKSAMNRNLIELLAADFCQLARIKRTQQVVMGLPTQMPILIPAPDISRMELVSQAIDDAIAEWSEQRSITLATVLRKLPAMVISAVTYLKEQSSHHCHENRSQARLLFEEIEPEEEGMLDLNHVEQVLCGVEQLPDTHRHRWLAMLQLVSRRHKADLAQARNAEYTTELTRFDDRAQTMPRLDVLVRYETHFRRCIEKTVAMLERRH